MKATKQIDELRALGRKLAKESKPPAFVKQDALKSLVRAAMSYNVSDKRADEAMRLIDREFVDLNELRVATDLEIQELLGTRYPEIEQRVALITQSLNYIFEREHTMSLTRLATANKRDARQFLRDLPGVNPFVEAYVMLYAFEGHAFPIDDLMLEYLREEEVLDPKLTVEEAQKTIEHGIKADECHDLFCLVRRAAGETEAARKKTKTKN